jgi:hypothetical protein
MIFLILLSPVLLYLHTPFTVWGSLQGGGTGNTQGGTQGGGTGNTQGGTQGGGTGNTQCGTQGAITSSDSVHYQNFKSCLSNVEVNSVATDKQVKTAVHQTSQTGRKNRQIIYDKYY